MKLIEKKCPNCGAGLSFDKDSQDVTCEYCKKSYVISKSKDDKGSYDNIDKKIIADYYNLIQKRNNGAKAIVILVTIIASFIVILTVSGILEVARNFDKDNYFEREQVVEEKKENYITEFEHIDEKSLEIFHKETEKSLGHLNDRIWEDVTISDWAYAGMYLLNNKDEDAKDFDKVNELYDVYKKTIVGKDINLEVYAAVVYSNLKLNDDNIVSNSFKGNTVSSMTFINGGTSSFVQGYLNNEDLYNKVIRSKSGDYNVLATEGLYIEN